MGHLVPCCRGSASFFCQFLSEHVYRMSKRKIEDLSESGSAHRYLELLLKRKITQITEPDLIAAFEQLIDNIRSGEMSEDRAIKLIKFFDQTYAPNSDAMEVDGGGASRKKKSKKRKSRKSKRKSRKNR